MVEAAQTRNWRQWVKPVGISGFYGFLAGIVAAIVLWVMFGLTDLIWSFSDARWYIFAVIMAGGALIAGLRVIAGGHEADLATQLHDAHDPLGSRHRLILCLAGMAIVAVAFGGAVGPEAGVLAVVAEMSVLVSILIGKSRAEQKLIGQAGAAGALSGVYASPPGGAAVADDDDDSVPTPLMFLAGVAGLLGFLLAGRFLLEGGGMRVHLADYAGPVDGTDMLRALPAAVLGGLAGLAFTYLLPSVRSLLDKTGHVVVQTLIGTLAFAALAAAFPILRFSGHHEMEAMLHWGQEAGMAALLALGLLKALVLAICLSAGWRGGAAFPLLFVGAAAGAAVLVVLPDVAPTPLIIAGMSAAITVGMGKPLAAMAIMIFLVSPLAVGPLCVGAMVGYGLSLIGPKSELH